MRLVIAAILLLVFPALVSAQQQPTTQLVWDHAAPVAEVMQYRHTVYAEGTVVVGTVSCTGNTTTASCAVMVPVHLSGPRTYRVVAERGGVERELTRTIDPTNGPAQPTNPRLQITVVVNVTQG